MSATSEERLARVALCRLGEPGDPRVAEEVAAEGAEQALRKLVHRKSNDDGLAADVAQRLVGLDPAGELQRAKTLGLRFVVPGDDEWPVGLEDLDHAPQLHRRGGAPVGLWLRGPGRLDRLAARGVAVVGSRSATAYGEGVAGEIAATVAEADHAVISGAAYGIDQAAHRAALAVRGATVAVLACGADRVYPSGHRDLIEYVAEAGLVVSEAPPGCAPTKLRFLARNRLIAGLAVGTVVVEAAIRSGAHNSAGWAEGMSRTVMAVPGPVTSATSQGAHELIRTRGALLVTCGADVLEAVSPSGQHTAPVPRGPDRPGDGLDLVDQQVLDASPARQAVSAESIARAGGLALETVRASLERLFALGLLERTGDLYRLRRDDPVG